MRKYMALLIGLCIMAFSQMVFAYGSHQEYLNGDPNFEYCYSHMGATFYIDKSSLVVQKYEPPQYIIAINVVSVLDGHTDIDRVWTQRFFYNYDLRKMYADRDGNSNWYYLNPNGSEAEKGGWTMPAGEKAFEAAYNMPFDD